MQLLSKFQLGSTKLPGATLSSHVMAFCPWHLAVLAGDPKDKGDEECGQYRANAHSPTHHGQQAKQSHQEDIPLVLNLRLQPLTELKEKEILSMRPIVSLYIKPLGEFQS